METNHHSEGNDKQVLYRLDRRIYRDRTTIGEMMRPDGTKFSWTLEDVVRAAGIKDKGNTAIPAGIYRVTVTYSNRFKRNMALIFNQPDFSLQNEGVRFEGIRAHGGNDHEDTAGCVLVAKNKISDEKIQGTQEKEFTAEVEKWENEGYEVFIQIINHPQSA